MFFFGFWLFSWSKTWFLMILGIIAVFGSKTWRLFFFCGYAFIAFIGCIDWLHWLLALIVCIDWLHWSLVENEVYIFVPWVDGCIDWLHWLVALIDCRSQQACAGFNKILHTCNTTLPQVWRILDIYLFLHSTRLFLDKNHVLQAFSKIIAKTSFNALVATFIGSRGLGLGLLPLDYAGASVFAASSNTAFLCACCFLSLVLDTAQLYSWVCTLVVHWVLLSCLFLITRLSISPSTCFFISRKPCCSALSLFFIDVTRLCHESGCEMWYDIVFAP